MDKSWKLIFEEIFSNFIKDNKYNNINKFIDMIYEQPGIHFPKREDVLKSFEYFKLNETKVIIIGQDCYIGSITKDNTEIPQAHGLSFSVSDEHKKLPPSLKNIFKEMSDTIKGFKNPENGDLTYLAKQGVLLLNCSLTVIKGKSNSDYLLWKPITDNLIKLISDNTNNLVFILWGNFAKSKKRVYR